MLVSVTAER